MSARDDYPCLAGYAEDCHRLALNEIDRLRAELAELRAKTARLAEAQFRLLGLDETAGES